MEIQALGSQIDGNDFGSPRCDFANWLVVMAKKPLGTTGEFFKRRDEWRKHPMLSNQLRHATPGLGIALVAFGIYLVGEQVYNRFYLPSSSSSSHGHHSASSTSATH